MVLVGLDEVKVGSLALGEAVLTVELELGGHNRVLTPAVHIKGRLSKDESSCIRDTRVVDVGCTETGVRVELTGGCLVPELSAINIGGTGILEDTLCVDEGSAVLGDTLGATKGVDGVGESINGVGVVERLGTEHVEEGAGRPRGKSSSQRRHPSGQPTRAP